MWLIDHPKVAILGIYGLAWWPHFALFGGRFWDDWVVYGVAFENMWRQGLEIGFPWVSLIFWPLSQWPPSFAILGFILLAISSIMWFEILERTPGVTRGISLASTILAVAAPVYVARFSWVQLQAIIGLVFFLFAWRVAIRAIDSFSQQRVIAVGVFLLISFSMYSAYLAVALALFLHLFWLSRTSGHDESKRAFVSILLTGTLVGIGWFLIRWLFFRPHGSYEGYQQIGISDGLLWYAVVTIIFCAVGFLFVTNISHFQSRWVEAGLLLVLSMLLFLAATGPYAAIGSFPPYSDWETRYEVNYPLVISTLMASIFVSLPRGMRTLWVKALAVILIMFLLFKTNSHGVRFLAHWAKSNDVIAHVEENKELYDGKFVLFIDETRDLDRWGWRADYEWTGLVAEGAKTSSTYALQALSLESAQDLYGTYLDNPDGFPIRVVYDFHWRDHVFGSPPLLVEITHQEGFGGLPRAIVCAFRLGSECVRVDIRHSEF